MILGKTNLRNEYYGLSGGLRFLKPNQLNPICILYTHFIFIVDNL